MVGGCRIGITLVLVQRDFLTSKNDLCVAIVCLDELSPQGLDQVGNLLESILKALDIKAVDNELELVEVWTLLSLDRLQDQALLQRCAGSDNLDVLEVRGQPRCCQRAVSLVEGSHAHLGLLD